MGCGKTLQQEGISVECQPPAFRPISGRRGLCGEVQENKFEHVPVLWWCGFGARDFRGNVNEFRQVQVVVTWVSPVNGQTD